MAFPWALRLELEGAASIRLERRGRTFRFDPLPPAQPGEAPGEAPPWREIAAEDVVVITDPGPDRVAGAVAAARAGLCPTVVADPAVLAWLGRQGQIVGVAPDQAVDGVGLDFLSYARARPDPRALAANPARLLRRAMGGLRGPRAAPYVLRLALDGGRRLVHLNLALHRHTSEAWLEEAVQRFGGADWLVVGVPFGEADAVAALLPRFEARRVLLADLTGDGRGAAGIRETALTPMVDAMVALGREAYVFATRSSLRFEERAD